MAPLHLLIKLRGSLDDFDDIEFDLFLASVVEQYGRGLLRSAIFNQFTSRNFNQSNESTLSGLLEIVDGIIKARDDDSGSDPVGDGDAEDPSTERQPVELSSLSLALFGEIASYLRQKEYFRWGQSRRDIYIATNTPNTLRELDLSSGYYDYSMIDLSRFGQLRTLAVNLEVLDTLPSPASGIVCPRLRRIMFNSEYYRSIPSKIFSKLKALPFSNITDLRLMHFGSIEDDPDEDEQFRGPFRIDLFLDLIAKFTNVQKLHLDSVELQTLEPSKTKELLNLLPHLEVLTVVECEMMEPIKQIVCAFSGQLRGLDVHSDQSLSDISSGTQFPVLEHFGGANSPSSMIPFVPTIKSLLHTALQSATALTRLHLGWDNDWSQKTIIKLLSEKNQLEQLVISGMPNDFNHICSAINRGLFNSRHLKKKSLQIKLWEMDLADVQTTDVLFNVTTVINALTSADIDHWLLLWRLYSPYSVSHRRKPSDWRQITERFVAENSHHNVTWSKRDLLVQNRGCKIQGIHGYMTDDWMTNVAFDIILPNEPEVEHL